MTPIGHNPMFYQDQHYLQNSFLVRLGVIRRHFLRFCGNIDNRFVKMYVNLMAICQSRRNILLRGDDLNETRQIFLRG